MKIVKFLRLKIALLFTSSLKIVHLENIENVPDSVFLLVIPHSSDV